jgi:hypothetical protein
MRGTAPRKRMRNGKRLQTLLDNLTMMKPEFDEYGGKGSGRNPGPLQSSPIKLHNQLQLRNPAPTSTQLAQEVLRCPGA